MTTDLLSNIAAGNTTAVNTQIITLIWQALSVTAVYFCNELFKHYKAKSLEYIKQNGICAVFKTYPFYVGVILSSSAIGVITIDYLQLYNFDDLDPGLQGLILIVRSMVNIICAAVICTADMVEKVINSFSEKLKDKTAKLSKNLAHHLKSIISTIIYYMLCLLPVDEALKGQCIAILVLMLVYILVYKLGIKVSTAARCLSILWWSIVFLAVINNTNHWTDALITFSGIFLRNCVVPVAGFVIMMNIMNLITSSEFWQFFSAMFCIQIPNILGTCDNVSKCDAIKYTVSKMIFCAVLTKLFIKEASAKKQK